MVSFPWRVRGAISGQRSQYLCSHSIFVSLHMSKEQIGCQSHMWDLVYLSQHRKNKIEEDSEREDVGKNHKQSTSRSTLGRRRSVCGSNAGDLREASHSAKGNLKELGKDPGVRCLSLVHARMSPLGPSRLASYVDTSGLHSY